jgi:hypothetical protein
MDCQQPVQKLCWLATISPHAGQRGGSTKSSTALAACLILPAEKDVPPPVIDGLVPRRSGGHKAAHGRTRSFRHVPAGKAP